MGVGGKTFVHPGFVELGCEFVDGWFGDDDDEGRSVGEGVV